MKLYKKWVWNTIGCTLINYGLACSLESSVSEIYTWRQSPPFNAHRKFRNDIVGQFACNLIDEDQTLRRMFWNLEPLFRRSNRCREKASIERWASWRSRSESTASESESCIVLPNCVLCIAWRIPRSGICCRRVSAPRPPHLLLLQLALSDSTAIPKSDCLPSTSPLQKSCCNFCVCSFDDFLRSDSLVSVSFHRRRDRLREASGGFRKT